MMWLAEQTGSAVSVGSNSNILLEGGLMTVSSPFSISRDEDVGVESIDAEEDFLDSDDEWDSLDQFSENELDDNDSVRT
jgi:hypothetical protein